ncbi:uncharacterized protein LOC129258914 [Lytechinus pictus]|uniref:uncharacterized protein LOC129258914 n=1 Tax=Lytechinus pictus TaxID=7653 RepID=UPI0030BA0637
MERIILLFTLMFSAALGLSFRNQPDTVTAYAGDTIYMRCDLNLGEVAGSSVHVTWIKSDNKNPTTYISIRGHFVHSFIGRFSIAGDTTRGEHDLMIQDVQYEDAGLYYCQVSGPGGTVITSVMGRLTVRVPIPIPTCSMTPSSPRVGQRVTFICRQQMHPSVDYEVLNWWNETSRSRIQQQGRYSDGSIFFTRLLSDSDQGQQFVCSQSQVFVEGERNCTVVPLPAAEVSTIANPLETIVINPTVKYVAEGSSATFGCQSRAAPVSRWVFGYGSKASKVRQSRGRFLVSADRSEFTVIRTTSNDNNTAVRCIVLLPSEEKLVAESILKVLPSDTQPSAGNSRLPPPPPIITTQATTTERPSTRSTRMTSNGPTRHRDTPTVNDPIIGQGTSNNANTGKGSQPDFSDGKSVSNVQTTPIKAEVTTKVTTKPAETSTRRDVVQIGANTDIDPGVLATDANVNQNHAGAPKIQTGGGYRVIDSGNTHQVSNQERPDQGSSSSGIVGAVMGSLLIIALIVLIIFLIKTKRYPKSVPTWIPPHVVAALKRPIDMVKKSSSDAGQGGGSEKSSKGNAPMRMKQIEVVVNPPPPEWQFRLKDVESNSGQVGTYAVTPRESHMLDGPVYANITPDLSKTQTHAVQDDHELDDDDDDSLFSSDFDDDLDLEGEIAAELVARSCESEGNSEDSIKDKKSKNVEGLVYAQLDMGPDAQKRSTVFIEGEKTQYAHIKVGNPAKPKYQRH